MATSTRSRPLAITLPSCTATYWPWRATSREGRSWWKARRSRCHGLSGALPVSRVCAGSNTELSRQGQLLAGKNAGLEALLLLDGHVRGGMTGRDHGNANHHGDANSGRERISRPCGTNAQPTHDLQASLQRRSGGTRQFSPNRCRTQGRSGRGTK